MNKNHIAIIVILVLAISVLSIAVINDRNEETISRIGTDETEVTDEITDLQVEVENIQVEQKAEQIINNNIPENMEETNKIEGLDIELVAAGDGAEAVDGATVGVHYTGKLLDGTVFDSSIERGSPIEFQLGSGMVIKGWDLGILGMKVGEKRILTIAAELAYGDRGIGSIPAGSTLIFDVELMSVK
jgi:FKBP-type peptidyl-prolyl cis-trans isomerase